MESGNISDLQVSTFGRARPWRITSSPTALRSAARVGRERSSASGKPKTPRPHVIDRYRFKTDTVGYLVYGHDEYVLDYDTELGQPWANRAAWDKLSFFYKVDKIATPTLFMGGEIDWNVPIVGSEQMYEAMKSLGRETELVVYPGEFHDFKTPSHIKDRLERDLAWYAHYVKKNGTPATPPDKS